MSTPNDGGDLEEFIWSLHCTELYSTPTDAENWTTCPKCGRRPRVWEFDNGRYAKCMCGEPYDEVHVSAESIGDVVRRTGGFVGYEKHALRDAWNKHADAMLAARGKQP